MTGGAWADRFGPEGVVFELAWHLDPDINSFAQGFTGESDVTLSPVPEPTVLALFAVGGLALLLPGRQQELGRDVYQRDWDFRV